MTQTDQLLLIDLSGIAHMVWHVSGEQNDPSYVSRELVRRVRDLASAHPHCAICCDNGKSFRKELDPTYKAGRDTDNRAPLYHQMTVACETLKKDGFPIWSVKGYEADDLIATATAQALAIDGTSVLIASSDKDLLALVSDRVTAKSIRDGSIFGPAEVFDKFGVRPDQIGDLLALMGDSSDNIKGAEKIGKTIGARLLSEHGTLEALYEKMTHGVVSGVTPTMRTNLMAFKDRWPLVRELITLRTDAPIELSDIAAERTAPPMTEETDMSSELDAHLSDPETVSMREAQKPRVPFEKGNDANDAPLFEVPATDARAAVADAFAAAKKNLVGAVAAGPFPPFSKDDIEANAKRQHIVPYKQPEPVVDFSQQLEPRSMVEAKELAKMAFDSRLFGAFGTPQAVLMTVLAGRELGLTAMASLRGFHMVDGKPTMSADLIRALIIKSGQAKFFRPTERSATRATWETQRGDDPPVSLTFTIEEAQQAGVVKNGSGWTKYPADMLTARASAKLARLVYSDIVFNLYDPSEIG